MYQENDGNILIYEFGFATWIVFLSNVDSASCRRHMESCARCTVHGVVHEGKGEKFRDVIRKH